MDMRLDEARDHEPAGKILARNVSIDARGDLHDAFACDADVYGLLLAHADACMTQDEFESHEPSLFCAYGRQWNCHNVKSARQFNTSH